MKLRGQRGDTTVAVILAAALVGVAAVCATQILHFMRSESQFSHATGTALAIESFILSSLQRPETYDPDTASSLRQGVVPPGFRLVMDRNGVKVPVADIAMPLRFNELGDPCTDAQCALRVALAIRCASSLCRAAYRIEFNSEVLKAPFPPLGAQAWPPSDPDYSQVISAELYRRQDSKTKCSDTELFVAGMNRSTGAVTCVGPTALRIPPNTIAKGMIFNASTSSLEFKTVPLKKGTCPAKYVAQSLVPASLETNPEGTCVYRFKKELPWMKPWPASAESVSGQFCPAQDYVASPLGSCTVTIISRTNGLCPKTCVDAQGQSYDCSYTVPPDTSYIVNQSVSGPNVSCSLVKTGTQQCGASWEGAVQWSGVCKITVPETVPMGGG